MRAGNRRHGRDTGGRGYQVSFTRRDVCKAERLRYDILRRSQRHYGPGEMPAQRRDDSVTFVNDCFVIYRELSSLQLCEL